MSEKISGYVSNVIYHNETNGYSVLELETEDDDVTLVGNLMEVSEGEFLEAEGSFVDHPNYGVQFKFETARVTVPQGGLALERYLSSGAIKGIGKALAERILKKFGEDTLRIMEEEPERLAEIKGISAAKAQKIGAQIAEKTGMRNAMMFLTQYGISLKMGARIYERYGDSLYQVIQNNPYQLADDIRGIGFAIADEIASRTGFEKNSPFRIRSGILYTLNQASGQGHCYLPRDILVREASRMLDVPPEELNENLIALVMDKKLVIRRNIIHDPQAECVEEDVYSSQMYFLELSLARMLTELNIQTDDDLTRIDADIARIEKADKLELDTLQKQAIEMAASHAVMVLTGGPGTGKTTTINTMIRYFQIKKKRIALAAPTGRAAKRMTEATGYEASTIHRLLEVSGGVEEDESDHAAHFERNADNPLDADVVIIDEMSMVDIYLMYALVSALTPGTRLILVGDRNQLQSVGPGSVLRDIIRCGVFPVICLTHIFRQAQESDIVLNAHRINNGEEVPLENESRDFFFIKSDQVAQIQKILVALVAKRLPPYVHADSRDIQVLTPMRKSPLGVAMLNQILQKYLNPEKPGRRERETAHGLFREGDKVMQIKNDYQLQWTITGRKGAIAQEGTGVFNGDIGTLTRIDPVNENLTVEFDEGKEVTYPFQQLDELELAYATTIHKAQGSEYPAVVIPLLGGPRMLMTRNLLYTAVTRAKGCVVIVGSDETFRQMINNKMEDNRFTSLADRILEVAK
ncbi:MAG: ATP-dependent RecD-like DNA helicase [Eubacterium sp.]|nr:ATP-dependent RecD-like DNA helicase [Eubacterium sp.]